MLRAMSKDDDKHVFISYVREDSDEIDYLCRVLEAAQIPYWRDRSALGPGDAWRSRIRQAIRGGSLVFLACFSENSRTKEKSYMNEELALAVEEFRQMPPGRTWLIPVRFDGGHVPEWDLGAGRTLSDLNYADLFGAEYTANVARLVTTVHRVMGDKQLGPAAALEAVERATVADRTDLLRRLTKEMLVDPTRRIELDDLVSKEVQRVLAVLKDPARVAGPLTGNGNEQTVKLAAEAQDLWELTKPFCASLHVAMRWGEPDMLTPWVSGVQSFVQAGHKIESGIGGLLELRHLPGMVSLMTAGLTGISGRKWGNIKTLVVDPTIRDRNHSKPLALLEGSNPWRPFDHEGWTANTLARGTIEGKPFAEALEDFTERRVGKFHTPVAEWVYAALRPIFQDQWADDDAYAMEFDRAEVVMGVLAQDLVNVRLASLPEGQGWGHSRWFGRSTWRAANGLGNAVDDVRNELATEGSKWGPLRGELFGGDLDRAKAAAEDYAGLFERLVRERSF